jgi:hypothetical protein
MSSPSSRVPLLLAAGLFLTTVLVFQPAVRCDFINFDDPSYVQNNPLLYGGLSLDSAGRAITTVHAGYWIPLTWLSYLVDYQLCGLDPAGYHRTNVLLHAASAALLFVVLFRMTNAVGRSLVAAALFALHPVQVESVAWVTERKDVLSTLFLVLALGAYARYAERPSVRRYLLVVLCFALGLMAKPMLVTLPVVVLLLDFWPLGRQDLGLRRLLLEKLPLFLLALAAGVLTILTQKQGTAVRSLDEFSLYARLGNAVVSSVVYLQMLVFPYPLAVFYPHPGDALPAWQAIGAALILMAVTLLAWMLRQRAPFLLVGWLWYLVTLAPVSGVLQAGWQGRADRFLYVPAIGLFILASWGVAALAPGRQRLLQWSAAGVLAASVALTIVQLSHWRDSLALWEHTFAVTEDNFVTRDSLAAALLDHDCVAEAVAHLERARAINPRHELAPYLLGLAAQKENRLDDAVRHLRQALALSPEHVEALAALAEVLAELKRPDEAELQARRALALAPDSAIAMHSLGVVQMRQYHDDEALACFRDAVRLDPHALPLRIRLIDELCRRGLDSEAERERLALRRLYPAWR